VTVISLPHASNFPGDSLHLWSLALTTLSKRLIDLRPDRLTESSHEVPSFARVRLTYDIRCQTADRQAEENRVDAQQEPAVQVLANGPFLVMGNVEVRDADGNVMEAPNPVRYALCRCDKSKKKPFCDGSHYHVGFKEPGVAPNW
jgi:CDGSH-type Zn-finger protein